MATDKKVTQLDSLTSLSGDDLFMVVDDPAGTPVNKKVSTTNLFGNVTVPVNVNGDTMTITANTTMVGELRLAQKSPPGTSNTATEGIGYGSIFYDHNFLYIAVGNNAIKRVTLEEF